MTADLRAMHVEHVAALAKIQAMSYNPLDVSKMAFVTDFGAYQSAMHSIERRLAAIIKQVEQTCSAKNKYTFMLANLELNRLHQACVSKALH